MSDKITIPANVRESLTTILKAVRELGYNGSAGDVEHWLKEIAAEPWVDGDVVVNHEGGSQLTYVRKDGQWTTAGRDAQRNWTCGDDQVDSWSDSYVALVRGGKVVASA